MPLLGENTERIHLVNRLSHEDDYILNSCSTVLMNKMYVFGGIGDNKNQILVADSCHIRKVGTLPGQTFK